ncbi:hypothetical protein TBLA_0B03130 [Henningerozyma blattae CBS 6284]|uniref:G-patch domain-containing protein n=1 Tax=Henningerozyma blattae (strain ATCC 34711 / CBS 6284 / DSM 70876 / NBRC 10599 / NRRL Y-10934 / UCD 77-7) TaxID=1071380 RepID=I2GYF2_HENB6|nr:hypothetical protein TBLA_0B03130 [Tetrapisispora blattae CBS 6284]CCH59154.1 hypothetical protein TBLA_0B03130 [Tetrapisispora blattae CBS 6284]
MDSKEYLVSYGWKEGEALRDGGLKKPILVKHKRDKKGLGNSPGNDDSEAWWERLFDGQLKSLDVSVSGSSSSSSISFKQDSPVATAVSRQSSPLYSWFVKGEGLKGTIGQKITDEEPKVISISKKRKRDDDTSHNSRSKKSKKDKSKEKSKKDKKEKKVKKAKKDKKDKKEKKEKKHKIEKKEKMDKKCKKEKITKIVEKREK